MVGLGDRLEQGLAHVVQAVAHLVADFQFGRAQFVGPPHHLNLGGQLRFELALIVHAQRRTVELIADQKDAAHPFHHRAATGFGGMRGEHRRVIQAVQHRLESGGGHALRLEIADGAIERAFPQGHAVRQHAAAVAVGKGLFGHVDQFEIAGKRTYHQFDLFGGHGVDRRHQIGTALLVFLLVEFGETAPQGLDGLEYVFAGELQQHLAQQRAQELDLRAQVIVGKQVIRCVHGGSWLQRPLNREAAYFLTGPPITQPRAGRCGTCASTGCRRSAYRASTTSAPPAPPVRDAASGY